MKNKKVIIVGIIIVAILVVIIATILVVNHKQSKMQYISNITTTQRLNIIMGMKKYDKNILCDTNIEINKNEIFLVFTAGNSYTQNNYGEIVVKVKLDNNTYEIKEIDTDFSELKDNIQKQLSSDFFRSLVYLKKDYNTK